MTCPSSKNSARFSESGRTRRRGLPVRGPDGDGRGRRLTGRLRHRDQGRLGGARGSSPTSWRHRWRRSGSLSTSGCPIGGERASVPDAEAVSRVADVIASVAPGHVRRCARCRHRSERPSKRPLNRGTGHHKTLTSACVAPYRRRCWSLLSKSACRDLAVAYRRRSAGSPWKSASSAAATAIAGLSSARLTRS